MRDLPPGSAIRAVDRTERFAAQRRRTRPRVVRHLCGKNPAASPVWQGQYRSNHPPGNRIAPRRRLPTRNPTRPKVPNEENDHSYQPAHRGRNCAQRGGKASHGGRARHHQALRGGDQQGPAAAGGAVRRAVPSGGSGSQQQDLGRNVPVVARRHLLHDPRLLEQPAAALSADLEGRRPFAPALERDAHVPRRSIC